MSQALCPEAMATEKRRHEQLAIVRRQSVRLVCAARQR
jgi:hypothetical protein